MESMEWLCTEGRGWLDTWKTIKTHSIWTQSIYSSPETGLKNKLINTCNKLKFATDRNCLFPSESFPAVFECQNKVKFAILSGLPCFNAGKMSNVIDFRWKSCAVVINHRNMDQSSWLVCFYAEILNIKILSNFNRIDAMIAKKHDLNCPECFKLEL